MGHHHHGEHHKHDRFGNPDDLRAYLDKLEGADRAAWQKPDEVIAALGLREGDTAAEVGAGPGYFAIRLARAVGAAGHVYAVDAVPKMLELLRERIEAAHVSNISPVLGTQGDPLLPPASCNVVLIVDAFHHFADGVEYLRRLSGALKPGGRIVNIDFHDRETPVGPSREHRVSREAFLKAAKAAGLHLANEHAELLPYQYFLVLRAGA